PLRPTPACRKLARIDLLTESRRMSASAHLASISTLAMVRSAPKPAGRFQVHTRKNTLQSLELMTHAPRSKAHHKLRRRDNESFRLAVASQQLNCS
ncbi:hypothetical protein, partial [Bradyrhizobium sp. CSA207]|uniref:hypothetical protein n=1 Tax=Bradyrhizobium sp. CSA207 TaxID=2698826 RepID=UPI0023B15E10